MEGSRKVQPNVAMKKCVCDILYQLDWIQAVFQDPCVFLFYMEIL